MIRAHSRTHNRVSNLRLSNLTTKQGAVNDSALMPRKPINKFLTRGAPDHPYVHTETDADLMLSACNLGIRPINIVSSNSSKPIKIFHRFPRTS